jgi:hypothetical protein
MQNAVTSSFATRGSAFQSAPSLRPLVGLLLACCYAVVWNLSHNYRGLDHDAHLYALQALARLDPQLYSNDIFFRFGSQDSYTIFTSLYAGLIAWLGLDSAASLLTLGSTLLYFCGAWLIARRLAGTAIAWLATGLLIVVELYYGGFRVFKTAEEFLTARLPAEAIGLCAIAAWLAGRRVICVGMLLFAILIHPLMSAPVVALIGLLTVPRHLRLRCYAAAALGYAGVLLLALTAPVGPIRLIDDQWLAIIQLRSYYLFPTTWSLDGWSRTTVVLATLLLAATSLRNSLVAEVGRAALAVGVIGLLLALSTEIWPIEILIQGQAWRWLWLLGVIALLSLPAVVAAQWSGHEVGRSCAVLLCASWLMLEMSGGALALLSVGLWLIRGRLTHRLTVPLNALAIGVFMITLGWSVSNLHTAMQLDLELGREPMLVEKARNVFGLTVPAIAVVLGLWLLATRARTRVALLLMTGLLAGAIPLMARSTVNQWTLQAYSRSTYDDFRDWRSAIPGSTEVLWLWNPVSTWLLLERPSYMSPSQSAGLVFSRSLAIEIDRRTRVLGPLGDRNLLLVGKSDAASHRSFSRSALEQICRDAQLGFVVATDDVGPATGTHEWPRRGRFVRLYDCRTYRLAGGAT